jgi:NitT/TauT family transport system substrate-binding protein
VLVFDVSDGADALLVRPGIDSLAALKGRRIGVEQSAVGGLLLREALDRAGLQMDDVRPVAVTSGEHLRAWDGGQIDAVVSFEPYVSQLERRGARRLFDSHAIPGGILDVLAVNHAAFKTSPQALRRLVQAHFDMRQRWLTQPAELTEVIAARLDLPREQLAQAFTGLLLPDLADNHSWLAGATPRLVGAARKLATGMLSSRLINAEPAFDNLASARFLPNKAAA